MASVLDVKVIPKYNADQRYKAICDLANQIDIDTNIKPKLYFHSGINMVKMATIYGEEGKYENAMMLYMKFIILFVEKLPKHPEYKSAAPADRKKIKDTLMQVFPVAENIQGKVKKKFQDEEAEWVRQEKIRQDEIAKEMAQLQIEKEHIDTKVREASEKKWLDEQEEKLKRMKESEEDRLAAGTAAAGAVAVSTISQDSSVSDKTSQATDVLIDISPPPYSPQVPDRDLKKNILDSNDPSVPSVDRGTKPFIDSPLSINTSNNSYGLRLVEVPAEIMPRFLQLAASNTQRNIETCAMLTGKMSNDIFKISHVLIPKQSGTSDTCDTENEEVIFDYQDRHDLFTLGWIHTHPSQTAFLSSIDMHTHCSYQLMLPEAIAIVCAPKYNETGIFSLTLEQGMTTITKCKQKGFHHHQQHPPLFATCKHVKVIHDFDVVIEDFRHK